MKRMRSSMSDRVLLAMGATAEWHIGMVIALDGRLDRDRLDHALRLSLGVAPTALIFTFPRGLAGQKQPPAASVCALRLRPANDGARTRLAASSLRLDSRLGSRHHFSWSRHPSGRHLLTVSFERRVPSKEDTTRTLTEEHLELIALSKGRYVPLGSYVTSRRGPGGYVRRSLGWVVVGGRHVLALTVDQASWGTRIGGGSGAVGGFCTRKTSLRVFDRSGTRLVVPGPGLAKQLFRSSVLKGRDRETNCPRSN